MEILQQVLIFIIATAVLVKSADVLVENAEKLGNSFKLPHFITGVLILSIGTSLPEFATGVASVMKGETDMLVSNIIGSDIANIFLGLGLVSVIAWRDIKFRHNIFDVHFPVFVMSVFALWIMMADRVITMAEGSVFLVILITYLWFLFRRDQHEKNPPPYQKFSWKYVILVVVGLAFLIGSSDILIDSVISLAELFGIAKSTLAGSLIAVGTSLPELVVGYAAIKRGNVEILVGNILGSNIFNILLIVTAGTMIAPLEVSQVTFGIMLPFLIGAAVIYWVTSKDQKVTIQEGIVMTALYVLFLGKLFNFL